MNYLEKDIVFHTAVHVKQARSQRLFSNKKIDAVKFSAYETNNLDHDSKVQTIIMDYCQNMNLPRLREDQPGDTYYFSLISIYFFGIYAML